MKNCLLLLLFLHSAVYAQVHPVAYANKQEFGYVRDQFPHNNLLKTTFKELQKQVDPLVGVDVDVPVPKDPAGGYTHDQHKSNYNLMYNAGLLYQITGDVKYAIIVKKMFLKYAVLNPTLKNHPQATSASPGRLFWQALNDANWLVYTGIAFDCIHDYLTKSEREQITKGAFKPIVDYFTIDQKNWFNLIHNHAVWATAGVGIVGIATDNPEYLQMALYGTQKDSTAGFIANLKGLFSPDGFYHEGPYYTRYALLPFYLFANAIEHVRPTLKIFSFRNDILKKALDVALNQTNLNGEFYTYNDALKDKTYRSNEMVVALDIAWQMYGRDSGYLAICKEQKKICLNKGGADISKALQSTHKQSFVFPYRSAEYTDGAKGDEGGLSILRSGNGEQLSTLLFKYTSHGLSHGHYDKLNIQFYDKGNEIIQDYGAARFINIEHKWGGRYLPETNSYAQQTIAHNTITVDETSHYNGNEKLSEANHPNKFFSSVGLGSVQVLSAIDDKAYSHVNLFRTIYSIRLPNVTEPLLVDIFKTHSDSVHQYDLPFNYLGTLMKTNFNYISNNTALKIFGEKNGYQHLWVEASAKNISPFTQFTFLNHQTFYTISSLSNNPLEVFFTRIGANDPNFNLRRDPSYILRTRAKDQTFVNVIETHGNFNPTTEIAVNSFSNISSIQKIEDNDEFTIAEIIYKNKRLLIIQNNADNKSNSKHKYIYNGNEINFTGPFEVLYDGKSVH